MLGQSMQVRVSRSRVGWSNGELVDVDEKQLGSTWAVGWFVSRCGVTGKPACSCNVC
jgi:hypothetical protein